MSIDVVRNALVWCAVVNYVLLVVWFLLFVFPHDWLYRLWRTWFRLPARQFDAINYFGIALYKLGILMFNIVPYLVLLSQWFVT